MSATQMVAPGLLLDKRKIDAQGLAQSGYLEAMTDFLELLQAMYADARVDNAARKVIEAIIEPLEARTEEIARDLELHAHKIGALRHVGPTS